MECQSTDNKAYRFPVSLKGICSIDGRIPLLLNERNEYELPGGKLEVTETPLECVAREIEEELNISIVVKGILDSWLYHINSETHVVIITYVCETQALESELKVSSEHKQLKLFSPNEIWKLNMPDGYKASIKHFVELFYDK